MFRKINIRLTLLFTSICSIILIIMSVFYMMINKKSIYESAFSRFTKDVNSFCSDLSSKSIINYDSIYELQRNYNYAFFIYDNDKPIRFTIETKTEKEKAMIESVKEHYADALTSFRYSGIPSHAEYKYKNDGSAIMVGIISIPGEKSSTDIYIINDLPEERAQIKELMFKFGIIISITVVSLFIFSYFFTKKLLAPIKRNNEQQNHFIAAASHEIRNPVNTIISALDAMKTCDEKERGKFAEIARKEGQRLTFLTEDLLTLARSDSKNFPIVFKPTELDTIILDCYEAFIAPASEKKIRINISLPEDKTPAANADPNRIKQVISIILNNAVSYTPESGVIDIDYSISANHHKIIISDNGPGISDEDKLHIFERFYRSDRSREDRSHFGLGLAIAKEIITLHNGKIQVSDNKYGGASFTISLPKNEK